MFIDSVELLNFRRFYGHHKVFFNFNDKKNVTIFSADNNSGKSTFVNALTWCLYGEELHDFKKRSEPFCNTIVLKETEKKKKILPQLKSEFLLNFMNLMNQVIKNIMRLQEN